MPLASVPGHNPTTANTDRLHVEAAVEVAEVYDVQIHASHALSLSGAAQGLTYDEQWARDLEEQRSGAAERSSRADWDLSASPRERAARLQSGDDCLEEESGSLHFSQDDSCGNESILAPRREGSSAEWRLLV